MALVDKRERDHRGTRLASRRIFRDKDRVLVEKEARGRRATRAIEFGGQGGERHAAGLVEILDLFHLGREKAVVGMGQDEVKSHQFALDGKGLMLTPVPIVALPDGGIDGSCADVINVSVVRVG